MKIKTSLQIDSNLLTDLKKIAEQNNQSISGLANTVLKEYAEEYKTKELDEMYIKEMLDYIDKNTELKNTEIMRYLASNYYYTYMRNAEIIHTYIDSKKEIKM